MSTRYLIWLILRPVLRCVRRLLRETRKKWEKLSRIPDDSWKAQPLPTRLRSQKTMKWKGKRHRLREKFLEFTAAGECRHLAQSKDDTHETRKSLMKPGMSSLSLHSVKSGLSTTSQWEPKRWIFFAVRWTKPQQKFFGILALGRTLPTGILFKGYVSGTVRRDKLIHTGHNCIIVVGTRIRV